MPTPDGDGYEGEAFRVQSVTGDFATVSTPEYAITFTSIVSSERVENQVAGTVAAHELVPVPSGKPHEIVILEPKSTKYKCSCIKSDDVDT